MAASGQVKGFLLLGSVFKGTTSSSVPERVCQHRRLLYHDNLRTRIVSATNRGIVRQLVMNSHSSRSLDAKVLRQIRIGQREFSVRVARESAN